jgi:hypothetical protein
MKTVNGKTALITGASSGIGKAFAGKLAAMGCNLIITARSIHKLEDIAAKIRDQHSVTVNVYEGDLFNKKTPQILFDRIKKAGLSVDILINNAGFGKWANFLDESMETYESMLQVNVNALVTLSHLFLPGMVQTEESGIINIGSTGSFQPCPYVAVYCATKAFVLSFSEALYGEYYKKGITVIAVCPGNTATSFFEIANADIKGLNFVSSELVAEEGITALLKGKNYKVTGGFSNYIQSLSSRFLPRKTMINIVGNMFNARVNKIRT